MKNEKPETDYRMCGAIDLKDKRDFVCSASDLKYLSFKGTEEELLKGMSSNDNVYFQDQKNTNECVPTATAVAMSSIATRTFRKMITFSAKYVRDLMIDRGLYDPEKGAYVQSGVRAVVNECKINGFVTDINGEKFNFPKFEYVVKDDWEEVTEKGYQIITGALVVHPMIDEENFYIPNTTGDGHCVRCIEKRTVIGLFGNSWRKFGIKKGGIHSGNFLVANNVSKKFFRGFIFNGVTRVN